MFKKKLGSILLGLLLLSGCGVSSVEPTSFDGYKQIEVSPCDLSGGREPNVVVDIGYGDREYWAFTNEYGQLVRVVADNVVLQDEKNEKVVNGRYCKDEAKVPGTERPDLDEGHVIADSLGGVSNAYNITPQDSTLNRHGDQAYMEKTIRDAGGCTNFEAIITYPDTSTQIPSHYSYTYTVKGNTVHDEFDNGNPDNTYSSDEVTDSNTTSGEVWVTNSGSKYHKSPNCGGMHDATQLSKEEAESKGYEACKKCYK